MNRLFIIKPVSAHVVTKLTVLQVNTVSQIFAVFNQEISLDQDKLNATYSNY